jgi:hypothetical protein
MENAKQALGTISQAIKRTEASKTLTAEEKRAEMERLNATRNRIGKQVMSQLER